MKRYDPDAELIWQDRKRWCGLPLSFTRYALFKKKDEYAKLVNMNGLLTTTTEEINLYRVDDIEVFQSLSNKIFGVGSITIYCKDASCEKLVLKRIKDPFKVKNLIDDLVIEDRERVGVTYGEWQ